MLSVMGAFAECERGLNHERQREGIALVKQRGANKGGMKFLSEAAVVELRERLTAGVSNAQVARELIASERFCTLPPLADPYL